MQTRERAFPLLFAAALLLLVLGACFWIAPVWQPGFAADSEPPLQAAASIRVDINTADEALLSTLPGIGQAKARAILQDRAANGPYASVNDVTRVKGIGEETVAGWKNRAYTSAVS